MEFDEYDYLEKTVENPDTRKENESTDGVDDMDTREKGRNRSSKHRNDVDDDVQEPAKRSKSGDDSCDNGRHKERDSSRHRSRDRERDRHRSGREYRDRDRDKDRDRDRSRDKEGKNVKEREDRDRSQEHGDRDRGREKKEKSDKDRDEHGDQELNNDQRHDRDRDHDRRESNRDGERDYRKERQRSRRSNLHSERHRSEYSEGDGSRSHDREHKERGRDTELKERDRESRRHKDKKDEVEEPEADPERDQRTVFAYQISLKADEREVYEFFSRAGKVRDVRLIMDRNSRRSRGVGYVEFYDVMSVPMAIALSGQLLLGQPVMVKPSEAEKNLVQSTAAAAGAGPYSGGARKLYVGNLHANMTEDQLRQVFEAFGTVELVQLPLDEAGKCKGFGFVQFARFEDAKNAVNLNGQVEIAGRPIKVSAITDHNGPQDGSTNAGDLDDEEGGGLALNAHSRAALMQKLDRSGTASSVGSLAAAVVNGGLAPSGASIPGTGVVNPLIPGSIPALPGLPGGLQLPTATMPSVNTIGVPSECLLLMNMFDPKLETEPDFELDIKEDVQEECSRYGKLKHVYVDKSSAGLVYLRFENTESAVSAQRALHGRWFAGKMITATFMVPQTYESKFPESV